jgi:hypothetical protein
LNDIGRATIDDTFIIGKLLQSNWVKVQLSSRILNTILKEPKSGLLYVARADDKVGYPPLFPDIA